MNSRVFFRTRGLLYSMAFVLSFTEGMLWGKDLKWTHFGLRPLGMGNAFVAVADDFNALFYNPAGLARLKEWDMELLNPTFEISQRTISFISDFQTIAKDSTNNTSQLLDTLKAQTGKWHHAALKLTPHFIVKHFGLGLGLDTSLSMVPHGTIAIELESGIAAIIPMAIAFNMLENKLSIGAGIKLRAQGGIDESEHPALTQASSDTSSSTTLTNLFKAGIALGGDIGMLFTPIETMSPTLGISLTDLGGSTFQQVNLMGKVLPPPPPVLPGVHSGISFKPLQTERTYLLLSADAHMLNHPVHFSKKFNLGSEFSFTQIFKFQLGLKEGYPTAGLQFDVGLLNLRLCTYTVDHTPIAGLASQNFAERRYAAQFKLLI